MEASERKRRLREEVLALEPPSIETRAAVVAQVGKWLDEHRPATVVGFLAMGDEIDMTPLVPAHPGIRFALTRTAPGVSLTVHDFDAPREMHRFGFEQPAAEAPLIEPGDVDVVLVPGLAFGRDGRRLGRGAGYYDRFLAGIDATTVALTTTSRLRHDLPLEPHDVLIDWVATEDGVSRTSTPERPQGRPNRSPL
jgi:5-formyltetrahydrofolate cyclo-ligase